MGKKKKHVCDEEGCLSTDTEQYHYFDGTKTRLCYDHAIDGGFCVWCGHFGAGSEEYDFSPVKGMHSDCADDYRAEMGEFDHEDDDFDDWFYPADWFDPDSDLDQLEDEPPIKYIGKGSEYES